MNSALLLGILIMGFIVMGCTEQLEGTKAPEEIPASVLQKYETLRVEYARSLGASIRFCGNQDQLYIVSGSGGFSGVDYYYDSQGNLIGSHEWDDIILPNDPLPPVNLENYTCVKLR